MVFRYLILNSNHVAFILKSGTPVIENFPKTASTAIACNAILEADGAGTVNPADSADINLFGISQQTIASTDADYASTKPIGVMVLNPDLVFEADVITGSATAALIGTRCDLANSLGVDVTATAHNQVTIVGVLSTTKVLVRVNSSYQFRNAA